MVCRGSAHELEPAVGVVGENGVWADRGQVGVDAVMVVGDQMHGMHLDTSGVGPGDIVGGEEAPVELDDAAAEGLGCSEEFRRVARMGTEVASGEAGFDGAGLLPGGCVGGKVGAVEGAGPDDGRDDGFLPAPSLAAAGAAVAVIALRRRY